MAQFVFGDKAIEDLLRKLPEKVAQRVTVNALRAGGRIVAKGMQQRVPVKTGKLKRSITVSSARKATKSQAHVVVGFRKPTSRRAHLTEFGTENARAQPFIRPTLEQDGEKVVRQIGENMGKGIVREAVKMRKR